MLPRNTKDRYDAIKKFCCVDKPGEGCVSGPQGCPVLGDTLLLPAL